MAIDWQTERKSKGVVDTYSPTRVRAVLGSGRALAPDVRTSMEPRFGFDFRSVRVHTDERAATSARSLHAAAYTVGQDLVFGAGRYQPTTNEGLRLLAHELTHVVQQSRGTGPPLDELAYTRAETEAEGVSHRLVPRLGGPAVGTSVPISVSPAGLLQAQGEGGQTWYEAAGEWTPGALGGEFIDEPTFGQIGADFVLSVIPGVDQVADARDLSAHIYRMGFRGEYNQWMRWVGLVFTLIGLIPEVGSVIKSLSRAALRGVGLLLQHIGDIIRIARSIIPVDVSDAGRLQRYVVNNWTRFAAFGTGVWRRLLASGADLAARIFRDVGSLRQAAASRIAALRRASGEFLGRAFEHVRGLVVDTLERVKQRLGLRSAEAPQPTGTLSPVPGAEEVRLSQSEYESALGRAFPGHHLNVITRTVDDMGERAAQAARSNPQFVQAVQSGNWRLAGTLFHSAAAREARSLPSSALPPGWIIQAEHVIQSGAGGSRADILLRGPAGELVEFDWKTTGRSALSSGSRNEMARHAGQITANIGGTLTTQQSRSWVDYMRPLMPGVAWP